MASEWPETLVGRIDSMIAQFPKRVAITEASGKSWAYEQMDAEIKKISFALLQAKIRPGSAVAVLQEPSGTLICSLLAILRIGGIYVPLDDNIPQARLGVMLAESKAAALLVSKTTLAQTGGLDLDATVTVLDISALPQKTLSATLPRIKASDPAAIIFTSGSSGVPKAVLLSHSNLRNHQEGSAATHGFKSEIVLQQSSIGFDMSLNQVFMALAHAGTLIIVPEALRKDFTAITEIIAGHKITYTTATPSEYLAWFRYGARSLRQATSWRFATAGGEKFTTALVQGFRDLQSYYKHSLRVFNAYGPTECSFSSNELEINLAETGSQLITAGKPLPNYAVRVIGEDLSPVPVGFPGQICIAGAGVAEYLNNPPETDKKFLDHPLPQDDSTRMYRTGDEGVLHADGNLEVLGRIAGDTQIKLRGQRLELQDIEQAILSAAKGRVSEVVVTPRNDLTMLVAHAVLAQEGLSEDRTQWLQDLAATLPLPQYMRPSIIVSIIRMPLTAAGKVDRKAIQNLPISAALPSKNNVFTPTEDEQKLLQIWDAVLPDQAKGLHTITGISDFFHVGGNSMLLIELRSLVKKTFGVDVPLVRFFEHSTLRAMAGAIHDISSDTKSEVDWEKETAIPNDYSELTTKLPRKQDQEGLKSIVLTGATGILGTRLLRLLTELPGVGKVHCIALRNSEKLAEFANSSTVALYGGDLSLPRCGLSETEAKSIFSSAAAIIHNGADVSFLKTYGSLRAANVGSTKELVRLALPYNVPFHFISTGTVGKLVNANSLAPASLANFSPNASFADGYAASKWASEVFLEKVNKQFGLPTFIHRPSSITGVQATETDIVANVLKYASILKALPDSRQWSGYVDLVPIGEVAIGIVECAMQEQPLDGQPTEYLHHSGGKVIPAQSIKEVLSADGKTNWHSIAMQDWIEQAVERGMSPLVGEFLGAADKGEGMQIGQKLLRKEEAMA